jgi:radical SAM superfamily enzyme YgiQ (UPF0313 family)
MRTRLIPALAGEPASSQTPLRSLASPSLSAVLRRPATNPRPPAVVLYNPRSTAPAKRVLPLSLLALAAVLEGRHEYAIVDGNLDPAPVDSIAALVVAGARRLAVTVMPGPQLRQAVHDTRWLKARFPHLTVIWGGYFPTQHWDVALRDPAIDYVIRGHGELAFVELLDRLERQREVDDLAGLALRSAGPGAEPRTNALAPIPDPELLPEFPYHRVAVTSYVRRCYLGLRTLSHHSSYGCPFFCNFCAVVNMVGGRWLPQSAERVANTVRRLSHEHRLDAVEFFDNNFFVSEGRTADFADRIRDLGIAWWGESRIDTLLRYSRRTWQLMRDSGLRMVFMGAESGSDQTLRRMGKGGTLSTRKTLEIARLMRAWGIVPEFSFVMGNPPDPEGDIRQTIEFIRRLKTVNPEAEIVMYLYSPVPLAGDLYDAAVEHGFRFPATLDEWITPQWDQISRRRSSLLPWMRPSLRARIHNFERVLNAYYPTSTDLRLTGATRAVLRAASTWRYRSGVYGLPLELGLLQRLIRYQRPETTGF